MNIGKIVGNVVATIKKEDIIGRKLLLVQPMDSSYQPVGEVFVALDTIGAGEGEYIIYTTSKEAIVPLNNDFAITDASVIAIIDYIQKVDKNMEVIDER